MHLLIHQDYGDHSRKAVIKLFTDGVRFWNPGDSFGDEERLLEPGEMDVRNAAIAMALRRIAMCEQAGTGLRMMQREWQALGHAAPSYTNDRAHKAFDTFLPEPRSALVAVTGQVTPEVTPEVLRLLSSLQGEMTRRELQAALELRDADHIREAYLVPALASGLVEMTLPDKPNSRLQRYRLTELGRRMKSNEPDPTPNPE